MTQQDPITSRFIEAFHWLKEEGKVRSARQFALGIKTYPQSLNDILKGRRDATLPMIQKVTEVYNINCQYLLTGQGRISRSDVNGISRSPQLSIRYVRAHEFQAFAGAIQHKNLETHTWNTWTLPEEMVGQNMNLAIQCNTDQICTSLKKGDVLFARSIPRESWKSSMSSRRIYVIALKDNLYVVKIATNDASGLYLVQDDRDLPSFISFDDILQVWSTISKWSPAVMVDQQSMSSDQFDQLSYQLKSQGDTIAALQVTIAKLSESMSGVPTY